MMNGNHWSPDDWSNDDWSLEEQDWNGEWIGSVDVCSQVLPKESYFLNHS